MKIDQRLITISDCLYRVSLKVVVIDNSRLLLVNEAADWFGLPGGGLDYGESIDETLARELQEELAITPHMFQADTGQPLLVTSGAVLKGIPYFNLYYRANLLDASNKLGAELTHRWVTKDEFRDIKLGPTIELARPFLESLL
jgi:8-oxo-dGTP pyrophosphatase MutT (NUDIX family)